MTTSDAENGQLHLPLGYPGLCRTCWLSSFSGGEVGLQLLGKARCSLQEWSSLSELDSTFLSPWCSVVGQDRAVGGEAAPVCKHNLAVGQTALEHHGLQQESWWALGGPQPLIFTILAPSLAGKMGKGLSGISSWAHTNRAFPCTLTSPGQCLS